MTAGAPGCGATLTYPVPTGPDDDDEDDHMILKALCCVMALLTAFGLGALWVRRQPRR
jgi:hypothetical protein